MHLPTFFYNCKIFGKHGFTTGACNPLDSGTGDSLGGGAGDLLDSGDGDLLGGEAGDLLESGNSDSLGRGTGDLPGNGTGDLAGHFLCCWPKEFFWGVGSSSESVCSLDSSSLL